MATNWLNQDGLFVKFGLNEATQTLGGSFEDTFIGATVVECELDFAHTPAVSGTVKIIADNVIIPKNSQIIGVRTIWEVAAVGGTSLAVGLYQLDRTTAIAAGGFVNAQAIAVQNPVATAAGIIEYRAPGIGNAIPAATAGGGTLLGLVSSASLAGLIGVTSVGTYTAGRCAIQIIYRPEFLTTNKPLVI